ncbi:MAG: hypothetical protein ACR2P7_09595, partial [bacterium]
MKNHFLVTVSDLDGSRHYMLRKSLKRRALYAFAAALAFVAGSVGYNYLQHQQVETLHGLNAGLERESALMHGRNTRLIRESAARDRQARAISRELSEIERIIGLRDAADDDDGPPRDAPLNLA